MTQEKEHESTQRTSPCGKGEAMAANRMCAFAAQRFIRAKKRWRMQPKQA